LPILSFVFSSRLWCSSGSKIFCVECPGEVSIHTCEFTHGPVLNYCIRCRNAVRSYLLIESLKIKILLRVAVRDYKTGFGLDDCIYWHHIHSTRNYT
jgi:hypothetical protein